MLRSQAGERDTRPAGGTTGTPPRPVPPTASGRDAESVGAGGRGIRRAARDKRGVVGGMSQTRKGIGRTLRAISVASGPGSSDPSTPNTCYMSLPLCKLKHLIPLLLLALALPASAQQTICQIDPESSILVKAVAWDIEDGVARMTDLNGHKISGRVASVREHDGGVKVNIEFDGTGHPLLGDLMEVVIFPAFGGHRMIGATFNVEDGMRHLHSIEGSYSAECASL